jgi:hypothetical protein
MMRNPKDLTRAWAQARTAKIGDSHQAHLFGRSPDLHGGCRMMESRISTRSVVAQAF